MTDRRLLIVEGADDQKVLRAILEHHRFQPVFPIQEEGGYASLLARLPIRLKPGTELEQIGVVVDAGADIQARWQDIRQALVPVGYQDIPYAPDPAGTVIGYSGLPRVGVWFMPNNASPGMLEDYLCELVLEGDPLFNRARYCLNEIPLEDRRFTPAHFGKALIHTWLAWQDCSAVELDQAITRGYFDRESPSVQGLLGWLTRLFA